MGAHRPRTRRERQALVDALMAKQARLARERRQAEMYPWQRPHTHPDGWSQVCGPECADFPDLTLGAHDTWLLMGGRGIGKTDGTSLYVLDHVDGPPCDPSVKGGHRIAIIAPTIGDAVESSVTGPSGLMHYDHRLKYAVHGGGSTVTWPNGARARLFGGHTPDDVNRLRSGGNTCLIVLEEAAAIRYLREVIEISSLGLRMGPSPHYIAATTPRVRPEIREMVEDPTVHRTWGTTEAAHGLDEAVRAALEKKYAGTTTGRQEMGGELLSEVAGAPWTRFLLDRWRVRESEVPPLDAVVIGLDPNAGGDDEAGISVVGRSRDELPDVQGILARHFYVLDDLSDQFRHPGDWARAALYALSRYGAARIVAEVNNGGNMVPTIIRQIDPAANVVAVHAAEGKYARTEPIVGLSQQGRLHIVGSLPRVEDQMTSWLPSSNWSPDRMDGLVWATTDLAGLDAKRRKGGGRVSAA